MCPFDSQIVASLKMTINKPPTNYIRELLELILGKKLFHIHLVFNAFIKGDTLRYASNTNNEGDFLEKVHAFTEKLLNRGYRKQNVLETIRKNDLSQ